MRTIGSEALELRELRGALVADAVQWSFGGGSPPYASSSEEEEEPETDGSEADFDAGEHDTVAPPVRNGMNVYWLPHSSEWEGFSEEFHREMLRAAEVLIALEAGDEKEVLLCPVVDARDVPARLRVHFSREGEEELKYCRAWRRDVGAEELFRKMGALAMDAILPLDAAQREQCRSHGCERSVGFYTEWTLLRIQTSGGWTKDVQVWVIMDVDGRGGHFAFMERTLDPHGEAEDQDRRVILSAFRVADASSVGQLQGRDAVLVDSVEVWKPIWRCLLGEPFPENEWRSYVRSVRARR
ncbi:uncharacterized protein B0I36DRAFT_316309 [Microdochium trichocladiopsis]|uniref:Uncharacterized protein n=1 Tax=Microdochium trichocladiopsis TaxID=1682393 RepID=A0A9P8YIA2_9PEZI|nr:uncharacterized protein B0I36DRAFT_316292 [Microdochium trichocladiopsis]XP_046017575.1 uncharacterized protein B0I36DRAFT_316309 [Microdochium trichocladiopsis]KAH7038448.1 hypothetical protein B0I36DRAFT_316292 [Microdochium trichocladiopsis]KAH7038454.1 hypothetical protein B0I36DRAFT_316309 [Microdochium trichocladiopsis]